MNLKHTFCPYLENVGNSGDLGYFWSKDLENTFRDETMAENGDKNGLITKELWFSKVRRRKGDSENSMLLGFTCWAKWDFWRNLYHPRCLKCDSTCLYETGDIKNVENELITTKIFTFTTRKTYLFWTASISNIFTKYKWLVLWN